MKITFKKLSFIISLIINLNYGFANPYKIDFVIKNQPDRQIILGLVKGDNFIPVDSTLAKNELVQFRLTDEAQTGIYRINMGQTGYAKVMNEDPQVFDFIFDKEDIIIETDFNSPVKSVNIILSDENKFWFTFRKKIGIIDSEISFLEKKLNAHKGEYNNEAIKNAQQYNLLQIERDLFLDKVFTQDSNLFAAQMVRTYKTPVLDGYLTEEERKEVFQKEYFNKVNFENEALIYSQCYTDNIFNYLLSYNNKDFTSVQREKAYKKAVEIILPNTNKSKIIYEFIVDYLKHGFEVLEMDSLVDYISNY